MGYDVGMLVICGMWDLMWDVGFLDNSNQAIRDQMFDVGFDVGMWVVCRMWDLMWVCW